MVNIPIISADSHAEEPVEIFERLPAKYRDRAPHIEERNGGTYYVQEGQRPIRQDIAGARLTEEDRQPGVFAMETTRVSATAGKAAPTYR